MSVFPSASASASVCELFNGCIYQRMLVYKVDTFLKRIKMAILFLIFLDQIRPKWIKLDQTWSNWISHQSKNVTIKSCHIYRRDKNGCFFFDFFGSDLSKMDQTWSKRSYLCLMSTPWKWQKWLKLDSDRS